MGNSNFCWGKRKKPDGALQIYSVVNGVIGVLHGADPCSLGYSIFYPYRGVEGNFEEYFSSKSLNGFILSPPWK